MFKISVCEYPSGAYIGSIVAREGMEPRMGRIVGFTETGKSARIRLPNGFVKTVRLMDWFPSIDVREARKWGFKG